MNNIESSSGIFIGTNHALGWSSYAKQNQGFGTLTDSTLTHSLGIVNDPDIVDAGVRDIRSIHLEETPNQAQQSVVNFGSIQANALNNGSAIDLGDNKQLGWRTSRKNNYGSSKVLGRSAMRQVAGFAVDNDTVDAPVISLGTAGDTSTVIKNILISQNTDKPKAE
ncbi:hypothetical protein COLU111180_09860 [Cohnella lubricantis]|uniref:Uncharacterized protein n=1 Tax=Cohnella lubricantis TaxID=2163172 RepID=A0A841TAR3_9BACL|nr:hypothetical protein [Cohnella lubricantis]MBB6678384.1 hypothetical protein [Cohnella lubricantis]MBP2116764.1 hypothetical protein [Cohnella lubricantis]